MIGIAITICKYKELSSSWNLKWLSKNTLKNLCLKTLKLAFLNCVSWIISWNGGRVHYLKRIQNLKNNKEPLIKNIDKGSRESHYIYNWSSLFVYSVFASSPTLVNPKSVLRTFFAIIHRHTKSSKKVRVTWYADYHLRSNKASFCLLVSTLIL